MNLSIVKAIANSLGEQPTEKVITKIKKLSPTTQWQLYLEWHGLKSYAAMLHEAHDAIFAARPEKNALQQMHSYLRALSLYWEMVPFQQVVEFAASLNIVFYDDSGNPVDDFLVTGKEGSVTFSSNLDTSCLCLSWYTMPSGRYEITAYMS